MLMISQVSLLNRHINSLHSEYDGSPYDSRVVDHPGDTVLRTMFTIETGHLPEIVAKTIQTKPEDDICITAITRLVRQGNAFRFRNTGLTAILGLAAKSPSDPAAIRDELWYGAFSIQEKGTSRRCQTFFSELTNPGEEPWPCFHGGPSPRAVSPEEAEAVNTWVPTIPQNAITYSQLAA